MKIDFKIYSSPVLVALQNKQQQFNTSHLLKRPYSVWGPERCVQYAKNHGKSLNTLGSWTLGTEDHTESGIKTKL